MAFRAVLEPSGDGGFTALVPTLPGCITEGNTREETLANIREAVLLYLYLQVVEDDDVMSPGAEAVEVAARCLSTGHRRTQGRVPDDGVSGRGTLTP